MQHKLKAGTQIERKNSLVFLVLAFAHCSTFCLFKAIVTPDGIA
jgi:hypothetical protein